MAKISYGDWTCRSNNCENPFDGRGVEVWNGNLVIDTVWEREGGFLSSSSESSLESLSCSNNSGIILLFKVSTFFVVARVLFLSTS